LAEYLEKYNSGNNVGPGHCGDATITLSGLDADDLVAEGAPTNADDETLFVISIITLVLVALGVIMGTVFILYMWIEKCRKANSFKQPQRRT
jgi:hypothetical protein